MIDYIKTYIKVWFWVLFLDLLIPVKSIFTFESKVITLMISFCYLFISIGVGYFFYFRTAPSSSSKTYYDFNISNIKRISVASSVLALIGLSCFGYDKAILQGLDYSDGIAAARHQFIDSGQFREDKVSSIYSIIGYFAGGFSFISLYFSLIFKEEISKIIFIFNVLASLICIMGISILTGGRTSVIIIVTVFWSAYILRGYFNKNKWPFSRKSTLVFVLVVLNLFFYNLYVFSERARTTNNLASLYMENMVEWMQGKVSSNINYLEEIPVVKDYLYFFVILWVYLTHSNWVFEGVFETIDRSGAAIFTGFWVILAKLKMLPPLKEWAFAGRFISWPGGVFYDFGMLGIVIFSFIHGFFSSYIIRKLKSNKITSINLMFFLLIISISVTSPFIIIIDVLMFPPMVVAFFALSFFLYLFKIKLIKK